MVLRRTIAKSPKGAYSQFRSNPIHGVQDCVDTMLKAQDGANHTARSVAHMVGPLLALVASHVDFFFSSSCVSQKNDVAKSLCPFDVEKVSETKKHTKTRKFALQC
jgi:hypothetical protein